jgi:hypothetical protein
MPSERERPPYVVVVVARRSAQKAKKPTPTNSRPARKSVVAHVDHCPAG